MAGPAVQAGVSVLLLPPMKARFKQVQHHLESVGCRVLAGLIPRLPRRVCLRLADLLGTLFFRFDHRNRAVALENLRLALGDELDAAERHEIARKSSLNFARAMLDLFWGRNLTAENYTRHITAVGFEPAREIHARGEGVIFLAMHGGSHEWLALGIGFAGVPATMVARDFKTSSLDTVFRTAREQSGNRFVGQRQSLLKMLRTVRRGGATGLLLDLALRLNHPGQVIDAFGMKMYVTFLHTLLHTRGGGAIVPVTNVPHPDGTCTVTGHPPLEFPPGASPNEITQICWDFFEPFIRARPDLWLWNYKHWRHKPRDAGREYPFYAQASRQFEEILAGEPILERVPVG